MTAPGRPLSPAEARAVGMLSFYDRFCGAPIVVALAASAGVSLAAATMTVSLYALLYAVGQPLWGLASDRLGRIPVLRVALAGGLIAAAAAALAPSFEALLVARAFGGLFIGALFPTVLTMIGDQHDGAERAREVSGVQTFTALGTTIATLAAGVLAGWLSWRLPFAVTLVAGLLLLRRLRGTTEHTRASSQTAGSWRRAFTPWTVTLYAVGIVEGALLQGVFVYLAPALHTTGLSVAAAGALAATYGVGVMLGSRAVRAVAVRVDRTTLIALGGGFLVTALLLAAVATRSAIALTVSALLFGLAQSFMHGSLQTWATHVAPRARATSVALFVSSVFLGSSIATAAAGPFVPQAFTLVFGLACAASVLLAIAVPLLHHRWERQQAGDETAAYPFLAS